ncbi:MAG: ATP-binding protein, partial [Chloroflexia bacterium]|nr:ATP-binding protein [Chloroflexia bacterium]
KEPSGAHQFFFWADDEALSLDVGHIVVAFSEEAAVIGVVDEPRRFSDLGSFLDDFFDRHVERAMEPDLATRRPEILVFSVNVLATKHLRDDLDSHRPPLGGPVYFATRDAIDQALDVANFSGVKIPALMHTNGNVERTEDGSTKLNEKGDVVYQRSPIWLDSEYLLGPEAGHANWTGQSGLATKTSHALFLTSAVFQKLQAEGKSVAALMFNVKGADLLWLDKPAIPEPEMLAAYAAADIRQLGEADREVYQALGLEPKPFTSFRIFAPFKPNLAPQPEGNNSRVFLEGKHPGAALNTQRTAPSETAGVVYPILWELKPLLAMPHKVFDHNDLDDKMWGVIYEFRERGVRSLIEMERVYVDIDAYFAADPSEQVWRGHHRLTLQKVRNRLKGLPGKLGGLLTNGEVDYGHLPRADQPFADQELRVIDIASCNSNVQEVLVSSIIQQIWRLAEEERLGVDTVLIFVDELNKYAPGGGESGLRDTLVDIAARGRHLKVVLFGAQQFRSKVDDEILGNCGTSLYGRVGDEELVNAAYRSLSETAKAELLGLPKGRLLVRHAHFRAPLFGAFPLPPTIPGVAGQKVFNQTSVKTDGHPADGLYLTIKRVMGERAPSRHEVRTLCEGHDPRFLDDLCPKLSQEWEKKQGTSAETRVTIWMMAQSQLRQSNLRVIKR